MEIIIQPNPDAGAALGAALVARLIRTKPHPVLGLCTGQTIIPLYRELRRLAEKEGLDFSGATTFNLDEFVGLGPTDAGSYHAFMHEHLFRHVNLQPARIHIPDGRADDVPEACARYEAKIRAEGGIDLQLLGIGRDGHIGFNEPTSSLGSRTRMKTLTRGTRETAAPDFGGLAQVPHHVITMGIGTILEARTCVLLAFGAQKADAVARAIEGPLSAMLPASALQLHPDARLILDEAAASRLTLAPYYREVFERKPAWQRP